MQIGNLWDALSAEGRRFYNFASSNYNTLGEAIAPLLFDVIPLPLIGIKYTLLIIPVVISGAF